MSAARAVTDADERPQPPTDADERPQPPTGAGFSDAVTFAFGDLDQALFGLARVGLAPGADGRAQGSGLALLFDGREPIAVRAAGGLPVDGEATFAGVDAAGVRTSTVQAGRAWDVTFAAEDGRSGFRLRFTAVSQAGWLEESGPAAQAGGMRGYEQLCRVSGLATVDGQSRAVSCLGQRGHQWGTPDWEQITAARTLGVWLGDDLGVAITAIRGASARSHADDAVAASLFAAAADAADDDVPEPGALTAVRPIADVRLSTTSDGDGRQRRAGFELYAHAEDPGRRGAGEVLCGTSLDLGRLRLDAAFFLWRMDGRAGVGRYDVLRRAT